MAATTEHGRLYGVEEYAGLPRDRQRSTELVRGRLVREPRPDLPHGRLQSLIAHRLWKHVLEHEVGGVVLTESGFILGEDPATVRGPDVAYVSGERLPGELPGGFARFTPDLAVEVLSPSDRAPAIQEKVLDYLEAGTRLVWVVDGISRSVTVYRSRTDIRVLSGDDALEGDAVLPGLEIALRDLFGD